jgi:uncharacterized membrane protein SpoIIM required for sporulation
VIDSTSSPATTRNRQLERERFEALIHRSEKLRVRGLPFDELQELSLLYRRHTALLSRLRDGHADADAIQHLNGLCVRAYAFLYSAGTRRRKRGERARDWPRLWRSTWRALVLAWGLLVLGATLGAALTRQDPAVLYAMLPVGFGYSAERIDRLWSSADERASFLQKSETPLSRNILFGSQLFAHNTRIGPLAFLAWLAPHAVPELTAITLCCAAGLILGKAVAAPGRRPRRVALREDSLPALLLVTTAVPLFLLAALTESFVRGSGLAETTRLGIASVYAFGLIAAHWRLRRQVRSQTVTTDWLSATGRPPT